MTDEQNILINELGDKIQQLIGVCEHAKEERDELRATVEKRDAAIGELTASVHELEEKNKKLQLAEAFRVSSEDTHDAKLKIGRIVREIDKCMALLS